MSVASVTWIERDGLLRSPMLGSRGFVAGFTTRAQGSMAGSAYPLDEQSRNRASLARSLGFPGVIRIKQVHRNAVVRVEGPSEPWPEADGMWTDRPGLLLGIAAADCVPVLIADTRTGMVGAAHAGWQGTLARVAERLVASMTAAGADAGDLIAAIGPSIGPCCYAIDDARAQLLAPLGDHLRERDGRIVFDLWSANAAQLASLGVPEIEVAGICTKSGGADLWSYRARDAQGRYGTQLGFIGRERG